VRARWRKGSNSRRERFPKCGKMSSKIPRRGMMRKKKKSKKSMNVSKKKKKKKGRKKRKRNRKRKRESWSNRENSK
jgi:hypothetical protein